MTVVVIMPELEDENSDFWADRRMQRDLINSIDHINKIPLGNGEAIDRKWSTMG